MHGPGVGRHQKDKHNKCAKWTFKASGKQTFSECDIQCEEHVGQTKTILSSKYRNQTLLLVWI